MTYTQAYFLFLLIMAQVFLAQVFLAPALLAAPVRLDLHLSPDLADQAASDVQLLLTHEDEEAVIPAKAEGEVVLDLRPGARWHLTLQSNRFWTPPREISASAISEPIPIPIPIYPAGVITGQVRVPQSGVMPSLTLKIQYSGLSRDVDVICPVHKGTFRCTVPATTGMDLRLSAGAPYIAQYFWDQAVAWEEKVDLGVLTLRAGASVIGWTTHSDGSTDFEQTVVTLSPWVPDFDVIGRRHRMVTHKATVNARGFYQFQGVPPGRYRLTIRHPRFATAQIDLLEIGDGEHELDAMELWSLATLAVEVVPATDPYQQPWQIRLQTLRTIQQQELPASGSWQADGLEHGTYRVSIRDSRDNVWAEEQVPVTTSWVAHRVEIETARLEVTFLLGGQPVTDAEVTFRGQGGNSQQRKTNDEGTAYVFLQAGQKWQVRIQKPVEGIWGAFREVAVPEAGPNDPWPHLTLELPDTELFGEVTFGQEPLTAPAQVQLFDGATTAQLDTEPDGSFTFRGIRPGALHLQARGDFEAGALRSAPARLSLEEGVPFGPVQLVLEPQQVVRGTVISPTGKRVAGALVMGLPASRFPASGFPTGGFPGGGAPRPANPPQDYTDAAGVFMLEEVPSYFDPMRLLVFPVGYAATQRTITLLDDAPVIPVSSLGGTLIVSYGDDGAGLPHENHHVIHTSVWGTDGLIGTGPILSFWARMHQVPQHAGRLRVPMLAPGPLTVCLEPCDATAGSRDVQCVEGFLPPGGELHLVLP